MFKVSPSVHIPFQLPEPYPVSLLHHDPSLHFQLRCTMNKSLSSTQFDFTSLRRIISIILYYLRYYLVHHVQRWRSCEENPHRGESICPFVSLLFVVISNIQVFHSTTDVVVFVSKPTIHNLCKRYFGY